MSESLNLTAPVNRSESIGKLVAALALAQLKFDPVLKDSKNPYYNSKYADLSSVIRATQGPLSENGLVVIQTPLRREQDAGVLTMLAHSSGEWISNELLLPGVSAGKDGKPRFDAQSVGSAITYARRYSYKGIIGVADEDDDGNAAAESQSNENKPVTAKSSARAEAVKAPGPVNSAPATQGTRPETGQKGSSTLYAAQDKVVVDGIVVKDRENAPANAQGSPQTQELPPSGLPTAQDLDAAAAEQKIADATAVESTASPLPTPEQFENFKKRAADLRIVLEKSGLKPSAKPPLSTGAKLVKYFTQTAGVGQVADLSVSQWNTVFSVLDTLVNSDPAKAVQLINERIQ